MGGLPGDVRVTTDTGLDWWSEILRTTGDSGTGWDYLSRTRTGPNDG